jgi:succinate dehydrogenase/fumarate reductase cytochrome b subunit
MKMRIVAWYKNICRYAVLSLGALLISPSLTFAQQAGKDSVQGYLVMIGLFINNTILPLIFTIALLFFLVNAARYFVFGGANEDGQDKARRMALYGIGAFVFLVSIWGIVNMLVSGLGIQRNESLCPDFLERVGCAKNARVGAGASATGNINLQGNNNYFNSGTADTGVGVSGSGTGNWNGNILPDGS